MKTVLVTGGTGFIGSHTVLELLKANYDVVVMDNLSNSKTESLNRVEKLTGKKADFHKLDLLDKEGLRKLFSSYKFDSVIHFAGLKAVGESVENPLLYFKNNISGTVTLCEVMQEFGVKDIVFSSSATVYGDPEESPIPEDSPVTSVNPYGRTKLTIEYILKDLYQSDSEWNIALLRYFNPVGAHESGLIGEDPNGIPNNLMPFVTKVAKGQLDKLSVFGNDYATIDGTGVRDYIHVVDLAKGHVKAIENLNDGVNIYNLGTGRGTSVLELVNAFMKVNDIDVPYEIVGRRPGDIATCFADASKAERELNWKAELGIEEMVRDAWKFEENNK